MISYLPMVNAWSLLYDVLNGTLDKEYPIVNKKEIDEKTGLWKKPDPVKPSLQVGAGNTAENDGLDYEVDLYDGASADYSDYDCLSDIDDQYSHHFGWDILCPYLRIVPPTLDSKH